jgi:hypothetical protein
MKSRRGLGVLVAVVRGVQRAVLGHVLDAAAG